MVIIVMRNEGPNLPIEYPNFFGRESIGIISIMSEPTIELAASRLLPIGRQYRLLKSRPDSSGLHSLS